jgi:hypothetical protein
MNSSRKRQKLITGTLIEASAATPDGETILKPKPSTGE